MNSEQIQVPFLDVGAAYRELRPEIDVAMSEVLDGGQYILGEVVEHFEREYAAYVGARHCIGVGNGLDALRMALIALDVGPGDHVIVPANTYIATWLAVTQVGATVIPVEPDDQTYNLDPDRLEAAITDNTKAVVPVHLYGLPADLTPIRAIAADRGLRIIEDAAQAHGASYEGRLVGSGSDVVAWSFYPGKNLGAVGDAGAVTTDDEEVARRVRSLRNYGSSRKYVNDDLGFNSRLDPIQAAVLRVKLRYLDDWNARRRQAARQYEESLAQCGVRLPKILENAVSAWHLFVVRTAHRDALAVSLAAAGVETMVHYPIPPHLQTAYSFLGLGKGSLPIAEAIHNEVLSLPIGPHLTRDQQSRVIEVMSAWSAEHV